MRRWILFPLLQLLLLCEVQAQVESKLLLSAVLFIHLFIHLTESLKKSCPNYGLITCAYKPVNVSFYCTVYCLILLPVSVVDFKQAEVI